MRPLLALALLAAPLAAADPTPAPRPLPDEAGFPAALRATVGDHFDYRGGEPGVTRGEFVEPPPRRFWFAKLRAKRPGEYHSRYTALLDPPATESLGVSDTAEYGFHVVVAKKGTRRVFQPLYRGFTIPDVVVGDTLILPVHTDAGRVAYRFHPVRRQQLRDPGFHSHEEFDDWAIRTADQAPPVRIEAARQFAVFNSLRFPLPEGTEDAPGGAYAAYLEFAAPGAFNIAGRLSGEPAGYPGRRSLLALLHAGQAVEPQGLPFRVVPRDRPVTVVLINYTQTHHYRGGSSSGVGEILPAGTLEARVGDTVVLDCGIDLSPPPAAGRFGVVEALPLRDVPPYAPR